MKRLNQYETRKIKKEFHRNPAKEKDLTRQDQLASASIVEMANRFGIDAIISKAKAIEVDQVVMDKLYGHDLTEMYQDKSQLLNVRNRLTTVFNNIPAGIRKEMFHDKPEEFVQAYMVNDEKKLEALQKVGIVSKTQLEKVKKYNQNLKMIEIENKKREQFTEQLKLKGDMLYENFKKTGDIMYSDSKNITDNIQNVQTNI